MNRRVILTRGEIRDAQLARDLESTGLAVESVQVLRYVSVHFTPQQRRMLARLGEYDWVVWTSPRAVDRLFAELRARDKKCPPVPAHAAVGSSTARKLLEYGPKAALIADPPGGARLAEQLLERLAGARTRVLFPAAAEPYPDFLERMRAAGQRVDHLPLYRAAPTDEMVELTAGDIVVLCSPAAARCLLPETVVPGVDVVAIGASTAAEIELQGWQVVVADQPNDAALQAAVQHLAQP